MPKSRVRTKAVYTPPPRATRSRAGRRWVPIAMLVCLLLGLAWIAVYYVTTNGPGTGIPGQSALGQWNLVVGFVVIIAGLGLATRWR